MLRRIRGWKVSQPEFSPFGDESQSWLSLFCFESHSGLSLFYVESHSEFSHFGIESLSVLNLFYVESHSQFSPFSVKAVLSSVHSGLNPFWVESVLGWAHLGLNPFRFESVLGWVLSGLSPFGIEYFWGWVHLGFSPIRGWAYSGSVGESKQDLVPRGLIPRRTMVCRVWYPAGSCSAGSDTPQDFVLRYLASLPHIPPWTKKHQEAQGYCHIRSSLTCQGDVWELPNALWNWADWVPVMVVQSIQAVVHTGHPTLHVVIKEGGGWLKE
jgi:hypothetical protein